jgi:hypothetical protein
MSVGILHVGGLVQKPLRRPTPDPSGMCRQIFLASVPLRATHKIPVARHRIRP